MVGRLVSHLWNAREQFIRYFVVGIGAVVLDLGTLYLLETYLHWSPVLAVVVNGILLLNFVFFMNKHWSFGGVNGASTHRQMVRFLTVSGFNYVVAISWMWLFTELWPIRVLGSGNDYILIRLANIMLSVLWNFALYKHWVYKTDEAIIETLKTLE
jgi:putative flippase GtrA